MQISILIASKRLGVHPLTIRLAIDQGRLPAVNVAPSHWKRPRFRIEESDFERFAKTYTRGGIPAVTVTE